MSYEIGTASDAVDLFQRLNNFLTTKGKAFMPSFAGAGNGLLSDWDGGASTVTESFEVTATSATTFDVVGSLSGNLGVATVGTPFVHDKLRFNLTAGTTPFSVGDKFKLNTCEPWQSLRNLGGVKHYTTGFNSYRNIYDGNADSYSNCQRLSWPGVLGMQVNRPVEVKSFQLTNWTSGGSYPMTFALEFSDDGVNWTVAQSYDATGGWLAQRLKRIFTVTSTTGAHAHWRVKFLTNLSGDYIDVAELFFCTDPSGSNESRINWEWELAWKTKGNDGLREIIVGAQYFWSPVSDAYNWRLNGWTSWNADLFLDSQVGGLLPWIQPMLFLWDKPMPYWFVANGQRVMIFARVGTIYMSAYLGLIDAFISPGQYPYPLFIGGNYARTDRLSVEHGEYRYSNTSAQMSVWYKGHYNNTNDANCSCGRLREPGGYFIGMRSSGTQYVAENAAVCAPWPFNTQGVLMDGVRPNLDGSYPLIRPILSVTFGAHTGGMLGEFDGLFATCGFSNAAENTFKEGLFTYVVWKDSFRADNNAFAAFKLD